LRWLADECVYAQVVQALRTAGHDVIFALETLRQTKDVDLAKEARADRRILLTEDKDFGQIAIQLSETSPGVVLLRIAPERRNLKWPRLSEAIERYGENLHRRFTVVDEDRIRSHLLGDDSAV